MNLILNLTLIPSTNNFDEVDEDDNLYPNVFLDSDDAQTKDHNQKLILNYLSRKHLENKTPEWRCYFIDRISKFIIYY
jgi:hypothetical protein